MKNSKIIPFVLMMAVLMQSGVSCAAEAAVSAPLAPIVSPATPTGVPSGAWYERYPKIALSLAGLGMSACLYGRAWWSNHQLYKKINNEIIVNPLARGNELKIGMFLAQNVYGFDVAYPDFIQVKLQWDAFNHYLTRHVCNNRIQNFVKEDDKSLNKEAAAVQLLHNELPKLHDLILILNEKTSCNRVIKDAIRSFANSKEAWHTKDIDGDYLTGLCAIVFQCSTSQEFTELDTAIILAIGSKDPYFCPMYRELSLLQWKLIKQYARTRYIWQKINGLLAQR